MTSAELQREHDIAADRNADLVGALERARRPARRRRRATTIARRYRDRHGAWLVLRRAGSRMHQRHIQKQQRCEDAGRKHNTGREYHPGRCKMPADCRRSAGGDPDGGDNEKKDCGSAEKQHP